MERLNEIMARTPRRRQHDTEQEPRLPRGNGASSQVPRPGAPLSRYSLPEQTARLGPASRSAQSYYQHKIPPRTRVEQGQSMPQALPPAYTRQRPEIDDPVPYQQHPQRQGEPDSYAQSEGFAPGRERTWGSPRSVPVDPVYSPVAQADVLEEWEDDAAGIRYGDWENVGNEEHTQFRPREPGAIANDIHPMNRPAARISQTSPNSSRSFVTRDLHTNAEGESRKPEARNDARVQPRQFPTPQALQQEARHPLRVTQPLRPQSTLVSQERAGVHTERQTGERDQKALHSASTADCPICKGAGYLRAKVPYWYPNFGKLIPCECKEAERAEKRRQQLREISNLGEFQKASFQDFRPNVSRVVQQAYYAALEYARNPDGWLVLIGPNGCGKTHLAAAIANHYLDQGALVLFAVVPELLAHLRAAFAPTSTVVYDQLFSTMREAQLLVLDDLGAQQSSPWANEKLFQLLNYRYNNRFLTIITTNNEGLQGIEERIRSRMMDASLVSIVTFDGAQDYRPRNPRRE